MLKNKLMEILFEEDQKSKLDGPKGISLWDRPLHTQLTYEIKAEKFVRVFLKLKQILKEVNHA